MSDRHLNLFYSYNQDNELIENNLTRALIVSLRVLSDQVRGCFLNFLLEKEITRLKISNVIESSTFTDADFALQGYMSKDRAKNYPYSYIITIASNRYEESEEEIHTYSTSIPDAWIYNETTGYCFLIEAKVGQNPLDASQLHSHAKEWLGLMTPEEVQKHVLTITWIDVLLAINRMRVSADSGELSLNDQECFILDALKEYLGFFNYKLFEGFEFRLLQRQPTFKFFEVKANHNEFNLPSYSDLKKPPQFQLKVH